MPSKRSIPSISREARLGQRAVGADDEAGGHPVATVGLQVPLLLGLVPHGGGHRRLEHGEVVEVVLAGDRLAVGEDLRALGVVPGGHVVHLVQKWEVVVGDHVAGHARVAVPVPGAADVAAALDDADALDATLAQAGRRQQGGEPPADEQDLDLVDDRLAFDDLVDVRVGGVGADLRRVLHRSRRAVGESKIALGGEPLLDVVVVRLRPGVTFPAEVERHDVLRLLARRLGRHG